jgi:hypothetical protein
MRFHSLNFPGQDFGSFSAPNSLLGGRLWARSYLKFAFGGCWYFPPEENLLDLLLSLRISIEEWYSFPGGDLVKSPDRCFTVGGDSGGNVYLISSDSGEIYVWWHDPDEVTRLDVTPFSMEELIEWSLRRDPSHPIERSWSTFYEIGKSINLNTSDGLGTTISIPSTTGMCVGHPQEYPFARIRERIALFGDFEEQFESDQVLALLQPHRGFLVEMTHELGWRHRCRIYVKVNETLFSDASFVEHVCQLETWMKTEGFCEVG